MLQLLWCLPCIFTRQEYTNKFHSRTSNVQYFAPTRVASCNLFPLCYPCLSPKLPSLFSNYGTLLTIAVDSFIIHRRRLKETYLFTPTGGPLYRGNAYSRRRKLLFLSCCRRGSCIPNCMKIGRAIHAYNSRYRQKKTINTRRNTLRLKK